METGIALPAHHQVLVVADQAGAEVTGWCRVGRGRQDVLRTVGGAVGGEVVILDETAVTVSTVEVVGQTALLNRKYSTLRITTGLTEQSYLDVAPNKGSVFLTEDTLQLLNPSHLTSNLYVPGRLGRVQNTGGEF